MRKLDYIAHHGILGQKWGIRRYQNKDGSYTTVGKQRYGYSKEDMKRYIKDEVAKGKNSKDAKEEYNRKYAKDDEAYLKKAINDYSSFKMYNESAGRFNKKIGSINEEFDKKHGPNWQHYEKNEYGEDDFSRSTKVGMAYEKKVLDSLNDINMDVAKEYGTSPSGRYTISLVNHTVGEFPELRVNDAWDMPDTKSNASSKSSKSSKTAKSSKQDYDKEYVKDLMDQGYSKQEAIDEYQMLMEEMDE